MPVITVEPEAPPIGTGAGFAGAGIEPPPSAQVQRYETVSSMSDDTMTKAGVPLGILRDLVIKNESGGLAKTLGKDPYDMMALAAKGQPPTEHNARDRPVDRTGFPIWAGSRGTGLLSHGSGAYSFEPFLWKSYAPQMGIRDFSKASQDAVFNAVVAAEGAAPWKLNTKFMADLAQAQQRYGKRRLAEAIWPPQQ